MNCRAEMTRQEIRGQHLFPFYFLGIFGWVIDLSRFQFYSLKCYVNPNSKTKNQVVPHIRDGLYIVKFLYQIPYWTLPLIGSGAFSRFTQNSSFLLQTFFLSVLLIMVPGTVHRNPAAIFGYSVFLNNHIQ